MPSVKYTKEGKKKQAEYQRAYRDRLKQKGLKSVTVFVPIDSDPNQFDLVGKTEDNRISEMRKMIDDLRDRNKGTIALAKQKDLVLLVQQLEEILE